MLEPEMEAFLLRLVPGLENEWEGATDEEIANVEARAGQPLPAFYRWLLSKMGGSAGSLPPYFHTFTVDTVLAALGSGEAHDDPPLFLISHTDDPMLSSSLFYDLSRPTGDDAFIMRRWGELKEAAEALRDHLAWIAMCILQVNKQPVRCKGSFHGDDERTPQVLRDVMSQLGFTSPLTTEPCHGLFERDEVALAYMVVADPEDGTLNAESREWLYFNLGGPDEGTLRSILGHIKLGTGFELKIREWTR